MTERLTAVYERHGDWIVAYIKEIPGVSTQGRTKGDAQANLQDALQEFLAANRDLADRDIAGKEDIQQEAFASLGHTD